MSESRIVVVEQTQCEHGNYGWHGNLIDHPSDPFCPGGGSRIIAGFPPEAVRAARRMARKVGIEEGMADVLSAALREIGNV